MRPAVKAFLAADNSRRLTDSACDKAFEVAFPRGMEIEWMHGEYVQLGTVTMHGYRRRLKALNKRTGREVWVDGYQIQMFYERSTSDRASKP